MSVGQAEGELDQGDGVEAGQHRPTAPEVEDDASQERPAYGTEDEKRGHAAENGTFRCRAPLGALPFARVPG